MSALITERDIQAGLNQAWHGLTTIVDSVTRKNSMPFEVIEAEVFYKTQKKDFFGMNQDVIIESPEMKQLVASDDWLPIGQPYAKTYHPSTIETFWKIITDGMGDTPYEIISAGTVDNRQKIFASLKVSDGFRIGDREFKDFITLVDSFDKSSSLQSRYSNVCVVCANTFGAVLNAGETIGKVRHSFNLDINIQRLIDSMDQFVGTSAIFQSMLTEASSKKCSEDEARAWITGVEGRNLDRTTNGLMQKTARIVELFNHGKGNTGDTRLDAFSAVTEFHTHESSNRKEAASQYSSSEWGTSAQTKTLIASRLNDDWSKYVRRGESLLGRTVTRDTSTSDSRVLLPA
jgi:hypothetical protein